MGKLSTSGFRSRGRLADLPVSSGAYVPASATHWYDGSDQTASPISGGNYASVADKIGSANMSMLGTIPAGDSATFGFTAGLKMFTTPILAGDVMRATFADVAQPVWVYAVFKYSTTGGVIFDSKGSLYLTTYIFAGNQYLDAGAGTVNVVADTNRHHGIFQFNTTSSVIYYNGTSVASGNAGTNPLDDGLSVMNNRGGSDKMRGAVGEIIVGTGVLSSGDRAALFADRQAKWGT